DYEGAFVDSFVETTFHRIQNLHGGPKDAAAQILVDQFFFKEHPDKESYLCSRRNLRFEPGMTADCADLADGFRCCSSAPAERAFLRRISKQEIPSVPSAKSAV